VFFLLVFFFTLRAVAEISHSPLVFPLFGGQRS
jgi:hypothetical protein